MSAVISHHHLIQARAVKTALMERCRDMRASPEVAERAWQSCYRSLACGASAAWSITQALRWVKATTSPSGPEVA